MRKWIMILLILICLCKSITISFARDVIIGPNEVMIPIVGESIAQYQIPKKYEITNLSLKGITLKQDGLLTITKEATPQTIVIVVTYKSETYKKEVSLYKPWSHQKEEFKKYRIKESIDPLTTSWIFTNISIQKTIKYIGLIISFFLFVGYLYKRKEKR